MGASLEMLSSASCRWIPQNDTLPCGEPYSGMNPVKSVNESSCQDVNGLRRSGNWQPTKAIHDPRVDRERIALGEWRAVETSHIRPMSVHAAWEQTAPEWINQTVAGVWGASPVPRPPAELTHPRR